MILAVLYLEAAEVTASVSFLKGEKFIIALFLKIAAQPPAPHPAYRGCRSSAERKPRRCPLAHRRPHSSYSHRMANLRNGKPRPRIDPNHRFSRTMLPCFGFRAGFRRAGGPVAVASALARFACPMDLASPRGFRSVEAASEVRRWLFPEGTRHNYPGFFWQCPEASVSEVRFPTVFTGSRLK